MLSLIIISTVIVVSSSSQYLDERVTSPKCSGHVEQHINGCLQPIIDYANSIQKSSDAAPFSLQGGEVFKKLCTLYNEFKDCTKLTACHSISIEAVEASYGYMCGAGHDLFEQHASCFAEVETEKEYNLCRNAAGKAMDDAVAVKKQDVELYFSRLCRVMDDYLRCCRPFVLERCGTDAWRLVSQITVDSLRVTMPNCDVNRALV